MTVTLDDVVCHLHISIIWSMMMHEESTFHECGVELVMGLLAVAKGRTIEECERQWGGFISIPFLKQLYDDHLNVATHLKNEVGKEEEDR
jgi:hypothetical protein